MVIFNVFEKDYLIWSKSKHTQIFPSDFSDDIDKHCHQNLEKALNVDKPLEIALRKAKKLNKQINKKSKIKI